MILLVGPPGAGKSVQAQLLEREANVSWLSMGKVLRENLSGELKEHMDKGELVDDDVVQDFFDKAVQAVPNGTRIVIDGFPRRKSQVEWFLGYVKGARRNVEACIHLVVPEDEVQARLKERGRQDDQAEVVHDRYEIYKNELTPVLEVYREKGVPIYDINGHQSIEAVHETIMTQLKGTI